MEDYTEYSVTKQMLDSLGLSSEKIRKKLNTVREKLQPKTFKESERE